jgi:hypothetical protein
MIKLQYAPPLCNTLLFFLVFGVHFQLNNFDVNDGGIIFIIALILSSILSYRVALRLIPSHQIILTVFPVVLVFIASYAYFGWDDFATTLFIMNTVFQIIFCIYMAFRFYYYGESELTKLKERGYPEWVIQSVMSNMLERRLYKQLKQKMEPRRASYVASKLAAGALSESLASGGGALSADHLTTQAAGLAGAMSAVDMGSHFSDDLLSRAMSIADHHIAAFDAGHWQTSGPQGMDINPSTGIPMMGGGIDIGGDAFGSSWHHDHSLSSPSFDSHYSDPFHDSAGGINTGSSFDDFNRY